MESAASLTSPILCPQGSSILPWKARSAPLCTPCFYAIALATEEISRAIARGKGSVSFWRGRLAGLAPRARVTSGYDETDAAVAVPQLFLGG